MIIGKRIDPIQKNSKCLYLGFNSRNILMFEYSPKIKIYYGNVWNFKGDVNSMVHIQNIDYLINQHLYNLRIKGLKK